MKITQVEVEELITLVERNITREISFVGPRIQSVKKINSGDVQKAAVRRLFGIVCELVVESVADGSLSPKDTLVGLLKLYKNRRV